MTRRRRGAGRRGRAAHYSTEPTEIRRSGEESTPPTHRHGVGRRDIPWLLLLLAVLVLGTMPMYCAALRESLHPSPPSADTGARH